MGYQRRVHGEPSSRLGGVHHTLKKPAPRSCKDARFSFSCFPHCSLPCCCSSCWTQRCCLSQLPILWPKPCRDPRGTRRCCYPRSPKGCETPTLHCLHCQPPCGPRS